ncbi:MAG TPA: D-glycero-beta-D-manno-heptose 1-phosphate adenylyltransferase [Longimicrobiales bacterium]
MSALVSPADKIVDRDSLIRALRRPRAQRVVFTNGVFDILHPGHVQYLYEARALGDLLVVALNTDDSVRRLKGPERPLNAQDSRAFVLAGLACVDRVTFFGEDTPRELIGALLPDVLVKGGDYRVEDVVGRAEVEATGGVVRVLQFREGHSTTGLVNRIRQS